MELKDFLNSLFGAFDKQSITYALIRNYEQLPTHNNSKDIDILVDKKNLPQIYAILFSINEISIVHISKRAYVHNIYIYNIKDKTKNSLQLDLVLAFEWNGIHYLDTRLVLRNSNKYNSMSVVSEYYEALILFFGKYLIHGILEEKYLVFMHKVIGKNLQQFIEALSFLENKKTIEEGLSLFLKTKKLNFNRNKLKVKLFTYYFSKNPFQTILRYLIHGLKEFKIRFSYSSKYILALSLNTNLTEIIDEIEHTTKAFKLYKPKEKIKLVLNFLFVPVYNHTTYIIYTSTKIPFIKRKFFLNNKDLLTDYITKRAIK